MPYATQAAMIARYRESVLIELTDDANTGAIDTVKLGQAMADADAEVDGYLAVRYPVPVVPTPALVERLACEIAYFRLHSDLGNDHPVLIRYRDTVALLKAISDGKAQIGPTVEPTGGGNLVEMVSGGRRFGRELS
ncbi:MAG TPA: DUF1320 domain-containing protein [Rhodocyclaceae bacterium]|nr:DUF1320 domain-containing protein [Rhodocyclaceae bacterium]